jgi:hypothetical protein
MARIIPLRDPHHGVQALLPWYARGRLDAVDLARVETHLAECADCRAEVAFDRRMAAAWVELPLEADRGWERLRARLATRRSVRARVASGWRAVRGAGLRWGLAAAPAAIAAAALVVVVPVLTAPRYRTLANAQGSPQANLIVMFHPAATERRMRELLRASDARLVGGPTVADAYLLSVPAAERAAALARLRASADVALAQPIDGGGAP